MTTILGPLPCQACRQPVAIVRRTVEVLCDPAMCFREPRCLRHLAPVSQMFDCTCHTHAIPDVAWTVVEADGERHLCPAAAA